APGAVVQQPAFQWPALGTKPPMTRRMLVGGSVRPLRKFLMADYGPPDARATQRDRAPAPRRVPRSVSVLRRLRVLDRQDVAPAEAARGEPAQDGPRADQAGPQPE